LHTLRTDDLQAPRIWLRLCWAAWRAGLKARRDDDLLELPPDVLAAGAWPTARTATIRTRIINVAARLAHRARAVHLHLPQHWPWQAGFDNLFTAAHPAPD